jgi:hypothetical protein
MNINFIANKYEQFKKKLKKHSAVQVTDNREILIDNCLEVNEYDDKAIIVTLPKTKMIIEGERLRMRNFNDYGVIITGLIYQLSFSNKII